MDRYRIRVAELEEQTKNMMIQIASVEVLQQENGNLKAENADLLNRQPLFVASLCMTVLPRLNQVFQERGMIQAQSLQTITKVSAGGGVAGDWSGRGRGRDGFT